MDRIWLVSIGIALLVAPMLFGTAIQVSYSDRYVDLSRVGTELEHSDQFSVTPVADLPPRARDAARTAVGPGDVTVDRYAVALFGADVATVAFSPDGVRFDRQRWFDRLIAPDFVRHDGVYYSVEHGRRETSLEHLRSERSELIFLAFVLPGGLFVYLGLRSEYWGP